MRQVGAVLLVTIGSALAAACDLELGGLAAEAIEPGDASANVDGAAAIGVDASAPSPDAAVPSLDAGVVPDADGAGDATAPADAHPPCAMTCNGQCVTTCAGCSAGGALCAATGECGDCSRCTDNGVARPVACYSCDANRQNPVGTCEPNDRNAYCLNDQYPSGRRHCACGNYDVSLCPGNDQECIDDGQGVAVCVTCGEPGTDGIDCKVGRCHANGAAAPRCQ